MNAILTIIEKFLNRLGIYRSKETTILMEVAGVLILCFYFFIKDLDIQYWLIWGVFAVVGGAIIWDIIKRNINLPKDNDFVVTEELVCPKCLTKTIGIEPKDSKKKCPNCKNDMDISNIYYRKFKDVKKDKSEWRKMTGIEKEALGAQLKIFPRGKSTSTEKMILPLIGDMFDDNIIYESSPNQITMYRVFSGNGIGIPVRTENFRSDQDNDPNSDMTKTFELIQKTINDGYFLRKGMLNFLRAYLEAFKDGKYRNLIKDNMRPDINSN